MKITKSQLREIIREEIQRLNEGLITESAGLLTEATRSQVGIIDKNGKVTSTYVHYDGYPQYMRPLLTKGFKTGAKVVQLLKTDKGIGISVLDTDIDGAEGHSFEKPVDGQTIFYGRDRGEPASKSGFIKADASKSDRWISGYLRAAKTRGAEWVYLYDMRDNKWYHSKVTDRATDLVEL
jgi:hypothetical protein